MCFCDIIISNILKRECIFGSESSGRKGWFVPLFFQSYRGGYIVIRLRLKTLVFGFIVCLCAFGSQAFGASADGLQPEDILQPQGLKYTGIYALRQADPNLTGSGVKIGVICRSFTYIDGEPQNDYAPDSRHNCLKNSSLTLNDPELPLSGVSPHSTAICSILFGEDPNAFYPDMGQFYYEGAAPDAQGEIHELWNFALKHIFTQEPPDADILTASFGVAFDEWWTRGIELLAESYGIVVVASIGNGNDAHNPLLYPAAGANVIGVGVVDSVKTEDIGTSLTHFALACPDHSSSGPTGNGRCKPDLVAPGNCLAAEVNEPNHYEPTGNWSSYATPIVAGAAGLLVQKAKEDPDLSPAISPDGGNCVIKAILMNSATKLPYWHKGWLYTEDDHTAPLDYVQGAGMLNTLGAYENLVAGFYEPGEVPTTGWDLNTLDKTDTGKKNYEITISEPTGSYITTTLAWNRHYNATFPFEPAPEKNSNLRLELWGIDPDNHNNDKLLDYSDSSIDNVEHIYFPADPGYQHYKIVICFSDDEDEEKSALSQRYGLAWNVSEPDESDLPRFDGTQLITAGNIFWYDLNTDGIVDELDFNIMLNNLAESAKSPESYVLGDIKPDGTINSYDIEALFQEVKNKRRADWYLKKQDKSG